MATQEIQTESPTASTQTIEIEIWYRMGPAYRDERNCHVIGDADWTVEWNKDVCRINYPYRCPGIMRITPRGNNPVFVVCKEYDNTGDEPYRRKFVKFFDGKEWKHIEL